MLLNNAKVSSPLGNPLESRDMTGEGHLFLNTLEYQLDSYINDYIQEYDNISSRLSAMIRGNAAEERDERRATRRQRRQLVAPDLGALQTGYSKFFGSEIRRKSQNSKKKKTASPTGDEMPIVLVPQEDETECVANNQLSSFGFLGFVLNVVNAVINVANNINNNDNSNNDNNNNNNNNDQNINQVSITETSDNTNNAMAIAGRRIQRLKMMRSEVQGHLRSIEDYHITRRRRSTTSDTSCTQPDIVDEALLTALALMDMWKEVSFEADPVCMALEFCKTSWTLNRYSRLSAMMADVSSVAAANMLRNFQGVNPEYLIHASVQGASGSDCTQLYPNCPES